MQDESNFTVQLGNIGGEEEVHLTPDQLPIHTHGWFTSGSTGVYKIKTRKEKKERKESSSRATTKAKKKNTK
jgi:microcystin-dependent protein